MSILDDILSKITEDSVSGSSEIYSNLLKGLEKAVTQRLPSQQWREFADGLSKIKRSMAPLQNVAGSIKVLMNASIPEDHINGFIKGFIMGLKAKETMAPDAIAEIFVKAYRPKRIVTISYSSTVMASLLAMPKDTEVLVAESLPLGEGAMTCRRLVDNGMNASLFRDSMMTSIMAKVDLVLIGADGVCPEGVVNKVGTRSLALAALERGKPVIVVCSTSKLIPVLEIDPVSSTHEVDGLVYHEDLFEISPLSLFASIITEEGVLSGNEMENRLLRDRGKMKNTECDEC